MTRTIADGATVLVDYFDTSKINLVNQAAGGRSFPSYVREGKMGSCR